MSKSRLLAYLALLGTAVIWGAATPVIKFTLGGIAAIPFLTYRFGISSLAATLSAPFGGLKLPKEKGILAKIVLYGFITTTVTLGFLFLGLERTTVLDTTIIGAVGPLVVVAAGAIFLKEHVTSREKLGISIALFGTLIAALEPLLTNGIDTTQLRGNLLVYLYLLSNGASAVLAKKLVRRGVSPLALTNISFVVGFLTILPLAIFGSGLPNLVGTISNLAIPYHLGVFYMALLSGSLAYTLWARAQRTIEIGEAAIFSYLYPIFSAPLAVFWLKEKMTLPFILGAAVVAAGVLIAESKKKRVAHATHR